jgi:transposase-like protein
MKKTMSLLEFHKQYRNEEHCIDAIAQLRWPKGFVCPDCGNKEGTRLNTRRAIQCGSCRHQISITAGTIFEKTRVSLLKWFWMIFLVAHDKGGASALRLAKHLGMHYSTVWHMLHKIRESMSKRDSEVIRLTGLIELDEGYFGGKKRKCQVLVMVEQEKETAGSLVMKRILGHKVASGPGIKQVVESYVDNESQQHFITDEAWAHNVLKSHMDHNLRSYKSTPESAAKKLPWVHMAISLAKRFLLGTYHGVSRKHMQKYLDEFCFRFNRRHKEDQIHESLIRACVLTPPISYAALMR